MEKELDEEEEAPDALFVAMKIKSTFKRTDGGSVIGSLSKIVEVPLNFIRDYTTPMADKFEWDRTRAAIIPLTLPWAFSFLRGMITLGHDAQDDDTEEKIENALA